MAQNTIVREAKTMDMTVIHNLIKELATFEGYPNGIEIKPEDLIKDGFETTHPWFFALVAEHEEKIVGYALCNNAYSSWTGRSYYIEDIYVVPKVRGTKIGHKLFQEICKRAIENNVHRIDWHVLIDNKIARNFYDSHGGYDLCEKEKRTAYRLDLDDIIKVANS